MLEDMLQAAHVASVKQQRHHPLGWRQNYYTKILEETDQLTRN